jgi:hypothetical protein
MQGESDADTELRVSEYEELYDTLIKDMNADFGEYLKDCIYVSFVSGNVVNDLTVKAHLTLIGIFKSADDTQGSGLTTTRRA